MGEEGNAQLRCSCVQCTFPSSKEALLPCRCRLSSAHSVVSGAEWPGPPESTGPVAAAMAATEVVTPLVPAQHPKKQPGPRSSTVPGPEYLSVGAIERRVA